jgi:hypothetical protein
MAVSRVATGAPKRMLSRTEPEKMIVSCGTTAMCLRKS